MSVFVDTSAVLALLVPSDRAHAEARAVFERLRARERPLVTTSYVLLETYALADRRMGRTAVREIRDNLAPLLEIVWVTRELHERGLDLLLAGSARALSLVDAVSFLAIRELAAEAVFAFDRHFAEAGFPAVRDG